MHSGYHTTEQPVFAILSLIFFPAVEIGTTIISYKYSFTLPLCDKTLSALSVRIALTSKIVSDGDAISKLY